jgi:NADH-quinone oxidoreductase subunit E
MSPAIPAQLEARIDELITHYPGQPRSASLMLLHAVQEHFGYISRDAVEWVARKLGLQPINVYELVTFYPMFRQEPLGRTHIKVCRTLSCALAGSGGLRDHFCRKLGLDPHKHAPQTTPDGKFTVEFVECLADCGNAPVVLVNDDILPKVTPTQADEVMAKAK